MARPEVSKPSTVSTLDTSRMIPGSPPGVLFRAVTETHSWHASCSLIQAVQTIGRRKKRREPGMTHKPSRTRFWTILTIVNIVTMAYPVSLYFQAESNDAQFFAAIAVLGVGFLLAIT